MADAQDGGNGLDIKTSLFGISLKGANAFAIFLILMLGLNIALTFFEHMQRHEEHDQIQCGQKLAVFIYTMPKGAVIDWERMPVDVYKCIPAFLYNRPTNER